MVNFLKLPLNAIHDETNYIMYKTSTFLIQYSSLAEKGSKIKKCKSIVFDFNFPKVFKISLEIKFSEYFSVQIKN